METPGGGKAIRFRHRRVGMIGGPSQMVCKRSEASGRRSMEPGSRPYTKPLIRYQKLAERVGFELTLMEAPGPRLGRPQNLRPLEL